MGKNISSKEQSMKIKSKNSKIEFKTSKRNVKLTRKIVSKQNKLKMLVWKLSKKKPWPKKLKDKLKLKPERLNFLLLWLGVMTNNLQWTRDEPFGQARRTKKTKKRLWPLWALTVKVPLYRHKKY